MGITSRLLLPYPELNDQANVPADMKELCDQIERVIGGALPQPKFTAVTTVQNVTSTADQLLNPLVTMANPHTVLFLLVEVTFGAWVGAGGNVFYGHQKVTGQTALAEPHQPRLDDAYENVESTSVATIAPGATLSAQLWGRKIGGANIPVNSNRGLITPIGWLKTGTI